MNIQSTILVTLLSIFISCGQTTKEDKETKIVLKKVEVGDYSFQVPSDYEVRYNDSINRPGEGYLMSNCAKMYFSSGGFGSGEILNKDNYVGFTILQDTTNNIIKMVAYKFDSIAHLEVHIAKLEKANVTPLFGLDNLFSNHNYVFLFNAMTNMGNFQPTCMTKNEMEVMAKEFMKGTIKGK